MKHQYQDLIKLFNDVFYEKYNTKLVKGGDEPIYMPADADTPYHRVVFAHGYFASAIHEISHWCIAGKERRMIEDYGYWYCPDGRDEAKQNEFQTVEIRPQALDWLFCLATDYPFNVSCDNLNGDFEPNRALFKEMVSKEVVRILQDDDIPPRANELLERLYDFYGTHKIDQATFLKISSE